MVNFRTVAILALATVTPSAMAQTPVVCPEAANEYTRCHGQDESVQLACCPGTVCVKRDRNYGQCRPEGEEKPERWDGEILTYSPSSISTEDDPTEEEPLMEDPPMTEPPSTPLAIRTPGKTIEYFGVVDKDYIPAEDGSNAVKITDISGNAVTSQMECEELCSATEDCNAASYYHDETLYSGRNCWLKMIADTCEVPVDVAEKPGAVLLLKIDEICDEDVVQDVVDVEVPLLPLLDADAPSIVELGGVGANPDLGDVPSTGNAAKATTAAATPAEPAEPTPPVPSATAAVGGTMFAIAVAATAAALL